VAARRIERGSYGDITLDGLNFSVYANWPGAIHEGNGEALILIDERADAGQRKAIQVILDWRSARSNTDGRKVIVRVTNHCWGFMLTTMVLRNFTGFPFSVAGLYRHDLTASKATTS
jgi:hypothetical protein